MTSVQNKPSAEPKLYSPNQSPKCEVDFLKLLAHDIKSPIHNMKLCLELLHIKNPELRGEEHFTILLKNLNKIQDMAKTLLELKVGGEEAKLKLSVVNVKDLVIEALSLHSPNATRREITLSASFEGKLCSAYLDRARVSSILSNLIDNALKYSPRGTRVDIHVERGEWDLYFEVRDQGVGVPEASRDRLFEPLTRVSGQPLDESLSHGLGLSLCLALVRSHGGRIGYRPREEGGSAFHFEIPQRF